MHNDDSQNQSMGDDSTAQDVSAAQDEQTVELDLDQLRLELQEAQTNIDQLTETSKRALADLQNYRRRVEEERAHMSRFATAGLLRDLLPVIDNFHRASTHIPQEVRESEWMKGIMQIEQQLVGLVKRHGAEEITSPVGSPLDPNLHEAVAVGPGEREVVIAEYEKGYMLGDQLLRPSKVQVGDGTAAEGEGQS